MTFEEWYQGWLKKNKMFVQVSIGSQSQKEFESILAAAWYGGYETGYSQSADDEWTKKAVEAEKSGYIGVERSAALQQQLSQQQLEEKAE